MLDSMHEEIARNIDLRRLRKKYSVEADSLKIAAHVYGLARRGNQILILPAWDGYDFPGGTAVAAELIAKLGS